MIKRRRFASPLIRILGGALTAGLLLATLGAQPTSQAAASRDRDGTPWKGGALVHNFAQNGNCTTGFSMYDSRFRRDANSEDSQRRWMTIAGHCGKVGDYIYTKGGKPLGVIDWKSDPEFDLATILIEPTLTTVFTQPNCSVAPSDICSINPPARTHRWVANADPAIWTGGPNSTSWKPVSGAAVAHAAGANPSPTYCFSGAYSGSKCGLKLYTNDLAGTPSQGFVGTTGDTSLPGDSGAPFYADGWFSVSIVGIGRGRFPPEGSRPAVMGALPIATVLLILSSRHLALNTNA